MRNWRTIVATILTAAVVALPFYGGAYLLSVVNLLLIHMTLALSWSLLLRSGQLSLGISGFFGLGVYVAALSLVRAGIHPLVGILLGGLMSGILALGVGAAVLHLRGMYFAIVTLALAEAFRVIIRNVPNLSGGPEGMVLPSLIFDGDPLKTFWLALGLSLSTLGLLIAVSRSKVQFALTAIRIDETVAQSSGVNVYQYLLWIFALSSAIQGLTGGLYAHIYGFISPEGSFSLDLVLLPIIMAVVGGATTTWGPVIGALLLGSMSELLKIKIPHGHLLIYGVLILIVVLFFPKGIIGTVQERLQRSR